MRRITKIILAPNAPAALNAARDRGWEGRPGADWHYFVNGLDALQKLSGYELELETLVVVTLPCARDVEVIHQLIRSRYRP